MPVVPFDTSKSLWLEPCEIVRVKDATDQYYDREGVVIDRTIYGGTVHFEDCDVKYRNDQLERLGQRRSIVWRLTSNGPYNDNGNYVPYRLQRADQVIAESLSFPIAEEALDRLMRPGDTYIETGDLGDPWIATYDQRNESHEKTRRWLAGER